jgi:hypothetical protein
MLYYFCEVGGGDDAGSVRPSDDVDDVVVGQSQAA